jgi:STE24 endopeptidase
MNTLTLLFLFALAAGLLLQLWLYRRHARHVSANCSRVPEAFAGRISLQDHQKAADYTLAKVRLGVLDLLLGTLLLLVWTLGGGLELILSSWSAGGLSPLMSGAAAILSLFLIQGVLDLPLSLWRTFRLEQRFGFNRTTAGRYVKDLALSLLLALLLGGPLILALLWLMERAGPLWWLYAWGLWMGFSLFVTWLYPTLIAPLFNKFTPLQEGELKSRIHELLQRCGFNASGIFVMDGSSRSAHGNAYFTGFGRSKRIVFFDTLMESLGVDEMEAVLAHELGHFKRRHVQKNLLLTATLTLAGFWILGWLMQQAWFYQGLGVDTASNAAALLLFLLVSPVFTQFLSPLGAWFMRRHEYEADDYAVEHSDGQPLIQALVKMYQDNASTLTPDPLFSAFHDSHPPAPVRIAHISSRMSAI